MNLLADLMLLLGGIFMLLGSVGLIRMPDVYTRVQAGTKATTLGSLALLLGVGLHHPDWWAKLLIIALFILLTSPLGGSTLIRAAHLNGQKPWLAEQDRKNEEKA